MTIHPLLKRCAALAGVLAPLTAPVQAAPLQYTVTTIGNLGGPGGDVSDINNAGHVVGYTLTAANTESGYLARDGAISSLTPNWATASYAYSINDGGTITGSVTSDNVTQAVTFAGRKVNLLGSLGGEGADSFGTGINNAGQVAGTSLLADRSTQHAIRYSAGVMQDLGTLGGSNSVGNGINASGMVAGHSDVRGDSAYHAFVVGEGGMWDLGTLGGAFSSANAINDDGLVAGFSHVAGNASVHAFLFDRGTMRDLGTLGGANSYAYGINNLGAVVGSTEIGAGGPTHAFVFMDGRLIDLNSLVPADFGYELRLAADINDQGQIAAFGCSMSGALCQGFLLSPVPEASSWAMLGVGGMLLLWARRRDAQSRSKG